MRKRDRERATKRFSTGPNSLHVMSTSQNHKIAGNVLTLSSKQSQQQTQPKKAPPPSQLQYPPRYQPPPQPPGGILKHITAPGTLSTHLKRQTAYYHTDPLQASALKYPPEVPKLPGVYLPDKNPSRIVPPRVQLRLSQGGAAPGPAAASRTAAGPAPPPPPPSVPPADDEAPFAARLSGTGGQPTQEMLKFVRKPDSEQPSPTSSSGGRISSAEHNRHLQVRFIIYSFPEYFSRNEFCKFSKTLKGIKNF